MKTKMISIIIPVYNEEENVSILYKEIFNVVSERFNDYEIIYINDGSTDNSLEQLQKLNKEDNKVKIINFRKNFGQSASISAGFEHCTGDIVVTLDADLQNDPADIPIVVEKLLEGYDMVNGWRKDRKDKFISRRIPSFFGNKLVSFITKVKLHDYGCSLRAFKKEVVKNLKLYGEMHRYLPAFASRMGIKSVEIPVNHRERKFGTSKYGIGRTYRVVLDLISLKYLLSFAHRPLQIFGGLGLIMMFLGFLSGTYLSYIKIIVGEPISGRPLLFFTVLLLFLGFQIITLGLIAEMLTKIYHEGLGKNAYSIRNTIGLPQISEKPYENIDDCT